MSQSTVHPPGVVGDAAPTVVGITAAGLAETSKDPSDMAGGGAAARLVSCAISKTTPGEKLSVVIPDSVGDLWKSTVRFPSADLLDAAAAAFPATDRQAFVRSVAVTPSVPSVRAGRRVGGSWRVSTTVAPAEGSWPQVEIAPGLVRLRRVDHARQMRTADLARERSVLRESDDLEEWAPADDVRQVLDEAIAGSSPTRGVVSAWSSKSRANMIATVASLDLAKVVEGENPPALLTATLPGVWLAATPDAATASAIWNRFMTAWGKKWGSPMVGIWKREFQRRGAPHWHIWTVPPVGRSSAREFEDWFRLAWANALQLPESPGFVPDHARVPMGGTGGAQRCVCSEWCRSIAAGTGIDYAEGLRARDPKRLAVYFLKESGIGEGKAYQNLPPAEWGEGVSVGRYWGYRGLEKAVRVVAVDPDDAPKVVRIIRKLRETRGGARTRRVPRSPVVVIDEASGEISERFAQFRNVNRRVRGATGAGWVAVNDGAAIGSAIGRYLSPDADGLGLTGSGKMTRNEKTDRLFSDVHARPLNECKRKRPGCRCDSCEPPIWKPGGSRFLASGQTDAITPGEYGVSVSLDLDWSL